MDDKILVIDIQYEFADPGTPLNVKATAEAARRLRTFARRHDIVPLPPHDLYYPPKLMPSIIAPFAMTEEQQAEEQRKADGRREYWKNLLQEWANNGT